MQLVAPVDLTPPRRTLVSPRSIDEDTSELDPAAERDVGRTLQEFARFLDLPVPSQVRFVFPVGRPCGKEAPSTARAGTQDAQQIVVSKRHLDRREA